jgi:hypothetical protein
MHLFLSWIRLPIIIFLRGYALLAALATMGGFLMTRDVTQFICFVVLPVTSFLCFVLADKYDRLLDRLETAANAR